MRRRPAGLAVLLVLVASCATSPGHSTVGSSRPPAGPSLTVMNLNLLRAGVQYDDGRFHDRRPAIKAVIEASRADVVVTEEANSRQDNAPKDWNALVDSLSGRWERHWYYASNYESVGVISRYPITSTQSWVTNYGGSLSETGIAVGPTTVYVYGLHGEGNLDDHQGQYGQLRDKMELRPHAYRIASGDLNEVHEDGPKPLTAAGYIDTYREVHPDPAADPGRTDGSHRLDRIFRSAELPGTLASKVVMVVPGYHWTTSGSTEVSDHFALLSTLAFPPSPASPPAQPGR